MGRRYGNHNFNGMKADDRLSRWTRRLNDVLSNLKEGDRVFITFDDYAQYHPPGGVEPHDIDDVGQIGARAVGGGPWNCTEV